MFSLHQSAGRLARNLIREGKFWRCKYWGLTAGKASGGRTSGIINVPLLDGVASSEGAVAITHWKLHKFSEVENVALVEFEPRTDVPGQIEAHSRLSLRTPLMESVGLHLSEIKGCLPGGDDVTISAPAAGALKRRLAELGFI